VIKEFCSLCDFYNFVNKMIPIGDLFLCVDCAKKFLALAREWIKKDVFNDSV